MYILLITHAQAVQMEGVNYALNQFVISTERRKFAHILPYTNYNIKYTFPSKYSHCKGRGLVFKVIKCESDKVQSILTITFPCTLLPLTFLYASLISPRGKTESMMGRIFPSSTRLRT